MGAAVRVCVCGVVLLVVPLLVALVVLAGPAEEFADLTRDMAATARLAPWVGFLGFVGVLYWTAGAAILLFASTLSARQDRDVLIAYGLLLAVLAVDDLFLLHEDVLPALGVPEVLLKPAYVILAAVFVVAFRRRFAGADRLIGIAALLALAASLGVDSVTNGGDLSSAVEDLLKFGGIVLSLVLAVRLSRAAVQRARPPASTNEARGPATRSDSGY